MNTEPQGETDHNQESANEETLRKWEVKMRDRLAERLEEYKNQVDPEFKAKYDEEIALLRSGQPAIRTTTALDAFAPIFQAMAREGLVSFGKDMENYWALQEMIFQPSGNNK